MRNRILQVLAVIAAFCIALPAAASPPPANMDAAVVLNTNIVDPLIMQEGAVIGIINVGVWNAIDVMILDAVNTGLLPNDLNAWDTKVLNNLGLLGKADRMSNPANPLRYYSEPDDDLDDASSRGVPQTSGSHVDTDYTTGRALPDEVPLRLCLTPPAAHDRGICVTA